MTKAQLNKEMKDLKLNHTQLAAIVGLSTQAVRNYMLGKSPVPRMLELSMEALYNRENKGRSFYE